MTSRGSESDALDAATHSRAPATNTTTELARERNRAATDRTLMAWIRTSLSLIGFGFGAGKVGDYLASTGRELDAYGSVRALGGSFISIGVLALFAAVIQHVRLLKRLEQKDFVYLAPWPIGLITAILLLVIGLFAFVAIFL